MSQTDTTTTKKGLTTKQSQAAQLIAEGVTAIAAAERVGVSRETLQRWKRLEDFQAAIREMEDVAYDESMRMLKRASRAAVSCLLRNMNDAKGYVQVAAASKLLDLGIEVHKVAELEREVAELKQLLLAKDVQ